MVTRRLREADIIARFGVADQHCVSCHEDRDEWGYELCVVDLDGEEVEVCCDVLRAVAAVVGGRTA